ncbi:hypothetical protein GCM10027612_02990 [Microbispora bryophytorum subsp. camponoti]
MGEFDASAYGQTIADVYDEMVEHLPTGPAVERVFRLAGEGPSWSSGSAPAGWRSLSPPAAWPWWVWTGRPTWWRSCATSPAVTAFRSR